MMMIDCLPVCFSLYCVDVLHDMTVNQHSWLVLDTNKWWWSIVYLFVSSLYCVDVLHEMTVNQHSRLVLDTN